MPLESVKDLEEQPYGFRWGGAKVERIASDAVRGWVLIQITGGKNHSVQVYVTKTGKIRVMRPDGRPMR